MGFWNYIHNNEKTKERFGETKQILLAAFVFLIIPAIIYAVVSWDPIIGYDERGDSIHLGLWILLGLYWIGTYFSYKSWQLINQLNILLDSILVDYESKLIFRLAIEKREFLKKKENKNEYGYEEGEKRLKWFNIK
jgi:hypothetical protein